MQSILTNSQKLKILYKANGLIWNNIFRIVFYIYLIMLGFHSLLMIMGWDQLNYHYIAYKMSHWNLLPYRDIYDVQFFGIYLYHLLIQKIFGYSHLGFRVFDLLNFVFLCFTISYTLKYLVNSITTRETYLILILTTASYYGLGWWWTGQREIFIMPYIFWSFYFYKRAYFEKKIYLPLLSGILTAVGFLIKPFYAVMMVIFALINLLFDYPFSADVQRRIRIATLTTAGFFSVIILAGVYLAHLGILSAFLFETIPYCIAFKKMGSSLDWNLFCLLFKYSPAEVSKGTASFAYMLSYSFLFIMASLFIGLKLIQKDIKNYFLFCLLFVLSAFLVVYQKTGEVANHHIPLVCLKAILSILFLSALGNIFIKRFLLKRISLNAAKSIVNLIILSAVFFLSLPFVRQCFDRPALLLLSGKINLEQYRSLKYFTKPQEDFIIDYINQHVNKEADEILYFCYSYYLSYQSRTKSFGKFNNNSHFIGVSHQSELYQKLQNELVENFQKRPPKLMVIRKDDNWWRRSTSFNEWSTSLQELMKMPHIKDIIEKKYQKVIESPSFLVFQKI